MYPEPLLDAGGQDLSPLLVDVHDCPETQVQRITVSGEMDMVSSTAVYEAVVDVLQRRRPRRIEIDLRGVSFLDSAGIRALLTCHSDARREDCRLTLAEPHPSAYRVLQITGLLDHFGLADEPPQ